MGTALAFTSATQALDMVRAGLRFLAAADVTRLTAAERAACLRGLEHADSAATAARTSMLGAFTASQDYVDDGDYSPFSWLVHRTQVTRGTAADHTGWVKRSAAHLAVHAALAAEAISTSYAREICRWTGKLPEDARAAADEILLAAAASGLELEDLAALAAQMYEKSRQDKPGTGDGDGEDGDPVGGFDDRAVNLATTFGGAGVIRGDLTPECAEFVQTVLDALSAPASSDDDRSHEQRYHDALQEAMRRLLAAGLLPERSGQPVKAWAYISLADLMLLDGSSALLEEWTGNLRARWAGHRAAAAEAGGHQGLWLDGDAAEAIACDAAITPVVVGDVNPDAFDDLIRLCVQLDKLRQHGTSPGTAIGHDDAECQDAAGGQGGGAGAEDSPDSSSPDSSSQDVPAAFGGVRSREALEQAVIGKAVELLSGPGGLASFLRRKLLGARLGGPSLPLDIGYSDTVPAGIRNAVRHRARHCEWAGGCSQPASACQVHHTRHKANGGKTSLTGCVLLCHYHHQVMIHRLGWILVVNPDGTTTAWNKDKTKVLHSHGPPARAG
jgi:Domain of unknown function (DUF222)